MTNPVPTKFPVPTTDPVQALRNGAAYLQAHGWMQGTYYGTDAGNRPPAACALGAIQIAVAGRPVDVFADGDNGTAVTDEQFSAVMHAAELVVTHLRRGHHTGRLDSVSNLVALAKWNDRDGRTVAEVVTAMRDTADRHDLEQS